MESWIRECFWTKLVRSVVFYCLALTLLTIKFITIWAGIIPTNSFCTRISIEGIQFLKKCTCHHLSQPLPSVFHLSRYPQVSRGRVSPPLQWTQPQVVPLPLKLMLDLLRPLKSRQPHQSPHLPQPQQDPQSLPADCLSSWQAERDRIRRPPPPYPHLPQSLKPTAPIRCVAARG